MDVSIRRQAGKNLREVRQLKKLTQRRLAKFLGISANHLYRIERGERDVTLDLLEKAAPILGVSVAALLGYEPIHIEGRPGDASPSAGEKRQAEACLRCGETRFEDGWKYCWRCGFPIYNLCMTRRHVNPTRAQHCVVCGDRTYWSLSPEEIDSIEVEPEMRSEDTPVVTPENT